MPLPPPPKTELKAVRDEQDIVAEEQWIPKMRQRIKVNFILAFVFYKNI